MTRPAKPYTILREIEIMLETVILHPSHVRALFWIHAQIEKRLGR